MSGAWKRRRSDWFLFSSPAARRAIQGLSAASVTAKTTTPIPMTAQGPGRHRCFRPFITR